jgi:5-formyltetrahydrofolate cyclo-ligase
MQAQDKAQLRKYIRNKRSTREFHSPKKVSENISSYLSTKSSISFLGVYAPLKDEVQWKNSEINFPYETCYPDFRDGEMKFYKSTEMQLKVTQNFGVEILTPQSETEVSPDAVLVPGLAFTKGGERLGRGKGFYDRFLENYLGHSIGVCLEEDILDEIPVDQHDQNVDVVITEKKIYP